MARLKAFIEGHKEKLLELFCALLLFVCIFPLFIYNMSVSRQIAVVISLTLSVLYITRLLKIKLVTIGKGMKYFMIACVAITLIWQIWMQMRLLTHGYPLVRWYFLFYYDKPFDVSVMLTVIVLIPTALRLFRRGRGDTLEWRETYRVFLKHALTSCAIIYIFILVFGFVINREFGVSVRFNFIPLKTMVEYFVSDKKYAYENTFLFMGNIAILLPFGFWFAIKKKKRRILLTLLLPVFTSCLIEFSQFAFKNGHVDIDDVILNVIGFYLGVLIKVLFDLIRRLVTHSEERTIFNL